MRTRAALITRHHYAKAPLMQANTGLWSHSDGHSLLTTRCFGQVSAWVINLEDLLERSRLVEEDSSTLYATFEHCADFAAQPRMSLNLDWRGSVMFRGRQLEMRHDLLHHRSHETNRSSECCTMPHIPPMLGYDAYERARVPTCAVDLPLLHV